MTNLQKYADGVCFVPPRVKKGGCGLTTVYDLKIGDLEEAKVSCQCSETFPSWKRRDLNDYPRELSSLFDIRVNRCRELHKCAQ